MSQPPPPLLRSVTCSRWLKLFLDLSFRNTLSTFLTNERTLRNERSRKFCTPPDLHHMGHLITLIITRNNSTRVLRVGWGRLRGGIVLHHTSRFLAAINSRSCRDRNGFIRAKLFHSFPWVAHSVVACIIQISLIPNQIIYRFRLLCHLEISSISIR